MLNYCQIFTFRKYDPNAQGNFRLYTALFRISSALAPTVFGLMVGGGRVLFSGLI